MHWHMQMSCDVLECEPTSERMLTGVTGLKEAADDEHDLIDDEGEDALILQSSMVSGAPKSW